MFLSDVVKKTGNKNSVTQKVLDVRGNDREPSAGFRKQFSLYLSMYTFIK